MSLRAKMLIEIQKNYYKEAVIKRQTELIDRGLEDEKIVKDPQLKHLRAKLRQANRRLAAVTKIEKGIEAAALRKAERAKREQIGQKPLKSPAKHSANQSKAREKRQRKIEG